VRGAAAFFAQPGPALFLQNVKLSDSGDPGPPLQKPLWPTDIKNQFSGLTTAASIWNRWHICCCVWSAIWIPHRLIFIH